MKDVRRMAAVLVVAFVVLQACGFDDTIREYMSVRFWLPFRKRPEAFERRNVKRVDFPYAGMAAAHGRSPLDNLRALYRSDDWKASSIEHALSAARAAANLTLHDKDEIDLIDAKIDMRVGEDDWPELLESSKRKLTLFVRSASTPELLSEARGWLAHVNYVQGNQTEAGKIYLDELNRPGSNLSEDVLLTSLEMTYGYDGGPQLVQHLAEYFDTAEHAAFAIQLVTNPRWPRTATYWDPAAERFPRPRSNAALFARIKKLLEEHRGLLQSNRGANSLATLSMRTALRMGDPAEAATIAASVPANAAVRQEPDFNWMLASARFLAHDFAGAEAPLLSMFKSRRSSADQRSAAAYGLCGVYSKTHDAGEQLRYALWLHTATRQHNVYTGTGGDIADLTVYWASSGWDLSTFLDAGASIDELRKFVEANPNLPDIRLVKYSLAVRLTRENLYDEAAAIYESIGAKRRAPRMRELAELYRQAQGSDEAKYKLAGFIVEHSNGIYFNDALWNGLQRFGLQAGTDYRLTKAEHDQQTAAERKLKDEQEERWRAFQILRGLINGTSDKTLARKATILAIKCLDGINKDRFGREEEILSSENQLLARLHLPPISEEQQ